MRCSVERLRMQRSDCGRDTQGTRGCQTQNEIEGSLHFASPSRRSKEPPCSCVEVTGAVADNPTNTFCCRHSTNAVQVPADATELWLIV